MMKMTMRKLLAILATLTIFCAVLPFGSLFSAVADGDNLVVNGGFESGEEGWQFNSGSHEIVTDAHTGSNAVKLSNPNAWAEAAIQTISVDADSEYTLSWYSKRVSGNGAFNVFPMNTADWSNLKVTGQTWMNEASGNWVKNQVVVETGAATSMLLKFSADVGNPGEILVDDIVLTKKGGDTPVVPTGDNLLVNGDFETGDATGWETWQSTAISVDAAKDGSYGAHLVGGGTYGGLLNQTATVEAGKQYKLTFWINVNKSGVNLQVKNGAGQEMKEYARWFDANTKNKQVEIVITAVDSGVTLNFCGSGTAPEDVYVDNFVLKEMTGGEPDGPAAGLVNGDFENGSEGWTLSSAASIISDDVHKGSGALKLDNPGAWSEAAMQKVAVKSNTEYVVEMYTKRLSGTGVLNLFMMNAADNSNLTVVSGESFFKGENADWAKRTIVINTGSATEILLKWSAEGNNAGVLLVDDMTIAEKGAEPAVEMNGLVANGDFETGDMTKWENVWDSCNPVVDETSRHTGDYGLHFVAPAQWNSIRNKITVEPNTDYTLIAWAANAKDAGFYVKTVATDANVASIHTESGNEWKKYTLQFNSGENTELYVVVIGVGEGGGEALVDTVGVYKTGEEPQDPDTPDDPVLPPISLSLDSFGVLLNRPVAPEYNLIANGSFENAEGGKWQELVGSTYYVVDDETAPDGGKSLFFNTSGVEEQTKLIFWVDVVPNTDYVFSTWLKGAFISDENRYDATIGVVDPSGNFLVSSADKFSNKDRQIVPPCWDNEWHLRSVQFNSGRAEQIGIAVSGKLSQLWIDDMALFTVNNAISYSDPAQFSYVGPMISYREEGGCAEEDSLIPDVNMDDDESVAFWSTAVGFENGFISFPENKYEYGTSMKYTASNNPCGTHAIKWVDVKQNTEYTFSVDVRVVKEGGGRLVLLDNKLRIKEEFLIVDFDQYYYGVDWFNVTVHFDTGNFDRIGIAVVDGGGEALIDNMRLFERVNVVEGGIKDKYVEPPYSFGDPDSPNTGVSVVGIVLAVAVVPTSAAVALGLRRRKEDEE